MEIKKITFQSLVSLNEFIDRLDHSLFVQKADIFSGSTVGQHIRHILEFYICLVNADDGVVCYDKRERQLLLETNIEFVKKNILQLIVAIEKINEDSPLNLAVDCGGEDYEHYHSSLYRELAYCNEHQTHHLAILKIGILQLRPDFKFNESFGVAYSTLKYRKACAQ